jgi:hypothetical protein
LREEQYVIRKVQDEQNPVVLDEDGRPVDLSEDADTHPLLLAARVDGQNDDGAEAIRLAEEVDPTW